ncbi:ribosomal protein S27a (nucleomorph) [Bigelowiella natans]|uniref:Ribosomal protein S27a n=1 Tax=Bigelowiella natans TaxID=227086 RepID=Q3LWK0_BIGNA|nr:ribosomal protein S27a [Bigelowiella natans]ABA27166.1 ribosomal protein S27a [Bigelowiella natans]|mmetsp:Transcript_14952/g.23816  ORF Transcript_14952/g.23816 Transcript_14952/m.23816 type:complete len:92 (-) Transcript_14952:6476-6751(-)
MRTLSLYTLRGGKKKKKKKKIPNTPKKISHIRKKVKCSILNIIKINSNGLQVNEICRNKSCFYSCFLANHSNRNSCGRCGRSYIKKKINLI